MEILFAEKPQEMQTFITEPDEVLTESLYQHSDLKIWSLFTAGDESAFCFIYRKYFPLLFDYAHRFSTNEAVIKDCIQDLFIYIRRNRAHLGKTTSIKLYLYVALRRRLTRYLKREDRFDFRNNFVDLDDAEMPFEFQLSGEQQDNATEHKLQTALQQLPERQKKAIYYFYFENFSYQEVAKLMDMTHVKSARNLIYKGLTSLKNYI